MVIGLCKDCKYWKERTVLDIGSREQVIRVGECSNTKLRDVSESIDKTDSDMLVYWAYKFGGADLEVGEHFGCIHFSGI